MPKSTIEVSWLTGLQLYSAAFPKEAAAHINQLLTDWEKIEAAKSTASINQ